MVTPVHLIPVHGVPEITVGHRLGAVLLAALGTQREALRSGDVLVVTSKVVSKAAGLRATDADRTELVLRESRRVVAERRTDSGITRVVEALAGPVMAGAGIDGSNVGEHDSLLLPHDPDAAARALRADLVAAGAPPRIGVVLSDTAGRPWRAGLTDFALGLAGIRALDDLRGADDVDGRQMTVTVRCLADELAAAADLVKGKVDQVPAAVVRGLPELVVEGDGDSARDLVRTGPGDWFGLGRAEAVRDALGVPAGSGAADEAGIESVHPEPVEVRTTRAVRVAGTDAEIGEARWELSPGNVGISCRDPLALGRAWGRLDVALAGERLRGEVVERAPDRLLVQVRDHRA